MLVGVPDQEAVDDRVPYGRCVAVGVGEWGETENVGDTVGLGTLRDGLVVMVSRREEEEESVNVRVSESDSVKRAVFVNVADAVGVRVRERVNPEWLNDGVSVGDVRVKVAVTVLALAEGEIDLVVVRLQETVEVVVGTTDRVGVPVTLRVRLGVGLGDEVRVGVVDGSGGLPLRVRELEEEGVNEKVTERETVREGVRRSDVETV